MLSPKNIAIIESTLDRLDCSPEDLSNDFYAVLYQDVPSGQNSDLGLLDVQPRKLVAVLLTTARASRNLESILPTLRDLGQSHLGYGVKDAHYPIIGGALLTALSCNVRDWSHRDLHAWSELFRLIAATMLEGAHALWETVDEPRRRVLRRAASL